jgi:Putative transposase of IS4/5 family (DUF4096)
MNDRRDICIAAGISPDFLEWSASFMNEATATGDVTATGAPKTFTRLSDDEWLLVSKVMPVRSRRHSAIPDRTYIDACLCVLALDYHWNTLQASGITDSWDACRHKYGRYCDKGEWQRIAHELEGQLTSKRLKEFRQLADDAETYQMKQRATRLDRWKKSVQQV